MEKESRDKQLTFEKSKKRLDQKVQMKEEVNQVNRLQSEME
jgi:hypothetical protein